MPQAAQRDAGCPNPGHTQGQVGQVSEQPVLFEDVPVYCMGIGLNYF